MKTKIVHDEAVRVLDHCAKPVGFHASGLPGGYEALWARDSMVTLLGALAADPDRFGIAARASIETLAAHQSAHGQIPNAVGDYNAERKSDITFNSIDSTLWYLLGHHAYATALGDESLLATHHKSIERALIWLSYQDPNEDGLPVQQPTMDWMDAFPHKYGRTLLTQALYYAVLRLSGKESEAERLKRGVNGDAEKYLSLFDEKRGFYLPWIWKSHNEYREEGGWFDTWGNLLAIVMGLATPEISTRILDHIARERIALPYPCKALHPPIERGGPEWHDYFEDLRDNAEPNQYLNGGIWPVIGGFYVVALTQAGQLEDAERAFDLLARANMQKDGDGHGFNEWLDGKTGEAKGNPYQAWSAGSYLYAEACLTAQKPLFCGFNE